MIKMKLRMRKSGPHKYIEKFFGPDGTPEYIYAKPANEREGKRESSISDKKLTEIKQKLVSFAVPMREVAYSEKEYTRFFPEGTVKTPVKTVKMGRDQFAKLGRKDSGGRQSYIGAAYQTLTDPVVVIKEGNDEIYIKSFTNEKGISTFMSVEKDKEDGRFVVTNYIRHKKEIEHKIKWADSIVYLKNDRGSPASMSKEGIPHANGPHTVQVSSKPVKKSTLHLVIKRRDARALLQRLGVRHD